MASPSSSEVEGSEDSDRTLRDVVSAIYEGKAVRNRFGSPVPFALDEDDMDEGDDDAGSEDSDQTVRAGDGGLGGGAYATVGSDLGGTITTATTTAAIAAAHNSSANNFAEVDADEQPAELRQREKSLLHRNGERVGVYGKEL